jgi:hypothetical protein
MWGSALHVSLNRIPNYVRLRSLSETHVYIGSETPCTSTPGRALQRGLGFAASHWFSSSSLDYEKEVEDINTMFVEARDEIEYALEDSETVSFAWHDSTRSSIYGVFMSLLMFCLSYNQCRGLLILSCISNHDDLMLLVFFFFTCPSFLFITE